MRVNIYAEEMTQRVHVISKHVNGERFTGVRFFLELPASYIGGRPANKMDTIAATQYQAPFMHYPGDDDSSAVTFWGKRDLRNVLQKALDALDLYYASLPNGSAPPSGPAQRERPVASGEGAAHAQG